MKKLTKQEQKAEAYVAFEARVDPALEAYYAIRESAWEAYDARLKEIDEQVEE